MVSISGGWLPRQIAVKWVTVAVSMAAAWGLTGIAMVVASRLGMMDVPNSRSSHVIPTPRGGGIAIVLVTMAALVITAVWQLGFPMSVVAWTGGGILIAATGVVDDIRALSPLFRLAIHLIAAALLLLASHGLPLTLSALGPVGFAVGCIVGAAAIVWTINSYNFMDGIDGLAGLQTVFVAGAGSLLIGMSGRAELLQMPLLALAGASAGFLIWNFPPAKVFMGDVGSGFVGYSIAAAAFLTASAGSANLWTWLILNGLFFADSTTTLLTRLLRGERVYEAHRSHVYQRLARRWGSHRKVTLTYMAINAGWCLPWAAAAADWPHRGPVYAALALVPLFATARALGAGQPSH